MIYFIQAEGTNHIKIGYTGDDDALVRLADHQTGNSATLRLLGTAPGTKDTEKDLHRRFAAHRVRGEWFKPVAELLALINPDEVKVCEGVETTERSVSIRVLTVGRKQFTKSLLEQLPEDEAVDWPIAIEAEEHIRDLSAFLLADAVWGWVFGGEERQKYSDGPGLSFINIRTYRWVIFERFERLYKCRDYISFDDLRWAIGGSRIQHPLLTSLYRARGATVGFRDQDQLFIGV